MKLRALEPEDLELLYTLENDPDLWETSESDAPYSKYMLKQYIAQGPAFFTSGELRLIIEINNKESGQPETIGIVDLTNYAPQSARAQIGIAILKKYRHNGYGHKALQLMEHLAVSKLHLHTLYAYVSTQNEPSVHLFNRNGYTSIGILPDWFYYNGKYEDVYFFTKNFKKNAL